MSRLIELGVKIKDYFEEQIAAEQFRAGNRDNRGVSARIIDFKEADNPITSDTELAQTLSDLENEES